MNDLGKLVLTVIAVIIGFAGAKYGYSKYREHKLNAAFDNFSQQAKENNPNVSKSEAMHNEGIKQGDKMLAEADSSKKKLETAAGLFNGYYTINVSSRKAVCEEQG